MTNPRDPSRRDFLAASAIGLIGLARGAESPALRREAQNEVSWTGEQSVVD